MKIMIWKGVTIQNQFKFLNQGPPANIMIDDNNHGSIDVNPSIATMVIAIPTIFMGRKPHIWQNSGYVENPIEKKPRRP